MRLKAWRVPAACLIWALPSPDVLAGGEEGYEPVFSTYAGGKSWEHARDVCGDKDGNVYMVGGTGAEGADGIHVDKAGNVFFTGTTSSANFPTTPGAFQAAHRGVRDAVLVLLSADFSRLLYSTLMGGKAVVSVSVLDGGAASEAPWAPGQESRPGDSNPEPQLYESCALPLS